MDKDEDIKQDDQILETDIEKVHAQAVERLEAEDEQGQDEELEDVESGQDSKEEGEEDIESEKPQPEIKETATDKSEPDDDAEEVDGDLKRKEFPKVKIRDSDGVEHEFDSIDDVPDDFEPETYKAFAKGVQELTLKAEREAKEDERIAELKEYKDRESRIKKIQDEWDKEKADLIKDGSMPSDPKEADKITKKVYDKMRREMQEGRNVDSFTHAFQLWDYERQNKERAKQQQELVDEKKKRGAKVLPGGAPTPSKPTMKGKAIEAPPMGIGLDAVHEKYLGSL